MKKTLCVAVLAIAPSMFADVNVQRVADDAKVLDRVAEVSKRDLPQALLKRMINQDIETLRGRRADGTYDYATYEKLEESRDESSYSVEPKKDDVVQHFEMKGPFVYRLIVSLPSRRMLVTKNRRVYLDHVELEYVPMNSSATQRQDVKVETWMEPGESRPFDFPEVARQGTARVFAKADDKAGYGNIVLSLVKARIVDNGDSPYADAVAAAKAVLRAIDNADVPSIRAMASRMEQDLAPHTRQVDVVASRVASPSSTPASSSAPASVPVIPPGAVTTATTPAALAGVDMYSELQTIEDLLTGSDGEKREGLDRLHQLVRRMRPRS
jgi:hypothetical protein